MSRDWHSRVHRHVIQRLANGCWWSAADRMYSELASKMQNTDQISYAILSALSQLFFLKLLATSLQTKDYDLLLQSKRLSTYHPHRQNKNIPSSKTLFVYTICNNWSGFLKRLSVFFWTAAWNFCIERLKMLRNYGRVTLQKCNANRGTYVWSMFHVYISYGKLLRSYLTRVQSLCYEALTGDGVLRIATASS